jgi:hypothetical protein
MMFEFHMDKYAAEVRAKVAREQAFRLARRVPTPARAASPMFWAELLECPSARRSKVFVEHVFYRGRRSFK